MVNIAFNRPYMSDNDIKFFDEVLKQQHLSGDGRFTKLCSEWLVRQTGTSKALLTQSCTAALELAAILLDIEPGDEVIMPSFTFVSTANAFALRGGVPVFVDIRPDTLNMDEKKIEEAITQKTKAIVPVHYAGVSCEMDRIKEIAELYSLSVIEDAAQGIMASYKNNPLGTLGDFGTLSFHETKNVMCGEGGAILVNNDKFVSRAEIIREKGTNRTQFMNGQVDKYTWQDIGSSYLPSEIVASLLFSQFNVAEKITAERKKLWEFYYFITSDLEQDGYITRPIIPSECQHNAHIFYVILNKSIDRSKVIDKLGQNGIQATSHYTPLHSSPAGQKYGLTNFDMRNTDFISENILRLPIWPGLKKDQQIATVSALKNAINFTTPMV